MAYGKRFGMEKSLITTFDEYCGQFPEDVRQILVKIRATIKESAPEATERISYQMPAFFQNGGLIWFGAYRRHIGIYPRTAGMMELPELSAYKGTKGSVHFPLDKPMPYELIRKIVKMRLTENQKKQDEG